jgi:hypothetical protein
VPLGAEFAVVRLRSHGVPLEREDLDLGELEYIEHFMALGNDR